MSDAPPSEGELAQILAEILDAHAAEPAVLRLKIRLRDMGTNLRDEVQQFRQLQRACRECDELHAAFAAAGFGGIPERDPFQVDSATGQLVQAFNLFVDDRWDEH